MSTEIPARAELVRQLRRFALADASYRPRLARALLDLAGDLESAGRLDEALINVREAADIYRSSTSGTDSHEILLIGCLNQEAHWLHVAGRIVEAEPVYVEEADIYARLAAQIPDDKLPSLAMMFNEMYLLNVRVRRFRSCQSVAVASLALGRRAASRDPDAEIYVASSLTELAAAKLGLCQLQDALIAAREAVETASRVHDRHRKDDDGSVFARALVTYSQIATDLGRHQDAAWAREQIARRGLPEPA
jgi:tetratricopeptide (TPR) repeat protein